MQRDYYINDEKVKTKSETTANRLAGIAELAAFSHSPRIREQAGRNVFTRAIDAVFTFVRKHVPPLHWLGTVVSAAVFFFYVQLAAFTARLKTSGETTWPHVPAPSVLALWHRNAPSLIVAFAKRRPTAPVAIMIAGDPRGDFLARLCRMLGFEVVRGSNQHDGWTALTELAEKLTRSACVVITADGGGPARVAKVGAVALASASGLPLVPIAADCHPAIEESRKWDAARNPVPFCSLTISVGQARRFEPFSDQASLEEARAWLEKTLNTL